MTFRRFEDIRAWQAAREVVRLVYAASKGREFGHDFGLRDQLRRAAVSIMANIAEGFAHRSDKEFARFLFGAKGSSAEESVRIDRKSTRLNSSHDQISYAVFCLKKKKKYTPAEHTLRLLTPTFHMYYPASTCSL